MSQSSIETTLIRPKGEVTLSPSLELPSDSAASGVLMIGDLGERRLALEALLQKLGANVEGVARSDRALALLEHRDFAFVLVDAALPAEQFAELVRRLRRDPRHTTLPIVISMAADGDAARLLADSEQVCASELARAGVLLAQRSPPGALEGQLALLIELHRRRMHNMALEAELEDAKSDLRRASDDNRLLAELETTQAQLVQAAKLATLGELVASVAHEINNPLSFSLSHLSTLRRSIRQSLAAPGAPEARSDSARFEERLASVSLGLERIKTLVVKLQTFSRLDEGKNEPIDVADAIGTVLDILQHRMHGGIHVTTKFGKPAKIQCDPSLVNQCVMNLLVNAIDAIGGLASMPADVIQPAAPGNVTQPENAPTPDAAMTADDDGKPGHEGRIHISAQGEGDSYVIRVIDSGHGVPAEIEHKIFDPFFTTKPVGKGTGLGLSIASSVVRKHDGVLTLSRAPEGGTEAVIRIPLCRVAAARRA